MSKYGPGVSMKSIIVSECKEVEELLDRSDMFPEDKAQVLDAMKEMAYQWCSANATACAMEDVAKSMLSEEQYATFQKKVMEGLSVGKKMQETFPF